MSFISKIATIPPIGVQTKSAIPPIKVKPNYI